MRLLDAPDRPACAARAEAALAKACGLGGAEIQEGLALIQQLQPHPGRPYQAHENDYVARMFSSPKKNGRWRVSLNPEHNPRLRINPYYHGLVKRADTSRDQLTLKQHLQEARYFINSLEARNETLLRVAQCIVEEQRAFSTTARKRCGRWCCAMSPKNSACTSPRFHAPQRTSIC